MIGVTPCNLPVIYRPKYFKMEGNSLQLMRFDDSNLKRDGSVEALKTTPNHMTKTEGGHNG